MLLAVVADSGVVVVVVGGGGGVEGNMMILPYSCVVDIVDSGASGGRGG